jgi:small subunit ribosomal protein S20
LTSKSAQKQVRVSSRRRLRNKSVRSALKTNITKAEKLLFAGEVGEAENTVAEAISSLDNAASKGIIHNNNAARRKARLMKKLNQVKSQAQDIPEPEAETSPAAEAEPKAAAKPAPKPRAKKTK